MHKSPSGQEKLFHFSCWRLQRGIIYTSFLEPSTAERRMKEEKKPLTYLFYIFSSLRRGRKILQE